MVLVDTSRHVIGSKTAFILISIKIKDLNKTINVWSGDIIEINSQWLINKEDIKWKQQLYNKNYIWLYKVFLSKRSNFIKEELLKRESNYFLDIIIKDNRTMLSLSNENKVQDERKEKNSETLSLSTYTEGYRKPIYLNDNNSAFNNILNSATGVKSRNNYLNILNDKFSLKNLFNIKIRINKLKHIYYKNIILEKYNNIFNRKMENKLTLPHYFFTSKYVAKSMTTQSRSWPTTIYSFMKPTIRNIKYLDSISSNLIKLFLSPISLKGKLNKGKKGKKKGIGGMIIVPKKIFGKYMNEVIKFTSGRSIESIKDVVDYTSSILTLSWIKRDLNWVHTFKKLFKDRRTRKIIGYLPKKKVFFNKARGIFLSKPLFRHTAFNLIIDLFVYNNKSYKLGKYHNMLKTRTIYKYMYSMYVNYNYIIQNIITRPRIFYINIIDPKIYYYYSNVLESYEKILISISRNQFIYFLIYILKWNFNIKIFTSFTNIFWNKKNLVKLDNTVLDFENRIQSKSQTNNKSLLNHSKSNILNLLNDKDYNNNIKELSLIINNRNNFNKNEISNQLTSSSSFGKWINTKWRCSEKSNRNNLINHTFILKNPTKIVNIKNISNNVNNYINKSLRLRNNINKYISLYNIEKKNTFINNYIHLINSKIIKKDNNAKLWWWNDEFYLLKEQGAKFSKANMKKQYLEELEWKSNTPVKNYNSEISELYNLDLIKKKKIRRVKVFGKDKFTFKKFKSKIIKGKRKSKLDSKLLEEQTMKYNLYSITQKVDTNPNHKWVYDKKTKIKVHISKYKLDNFIFDKIKEKRKKMKLLRKKLFNKNSIVKVNYNLKKNKMNKVNASIHSTTSNIIKVNNNKTKWSPNFKHKKDKTIVTLYKDNNIKTNIFKHKNKSQKKNIIYNPDKFNHKNNNINKSTINKEHSNINYINNYNNNSNLHKKKNEKNISSNKNKDKVKYNTTPISYVETKPLSINIIKKHPSSNITNNNNYNFNKIRNKPYNKINIGNKFYNSRNEKNKDYIFIGKNNKNYNPSGMNNKRKVHTWTNYLKFASSKIIEQESKKKFLKNQPRKNNKKSKYFIFKGIKNNNYFNIFSSKKREKPKISSILEIIIRKKYSNEINNNELKWKRIKWLLKINKKYFEKIRSIKTIKNIENTKNIEKSRYSKFSKLNKRKDIDWWKSFINYWNTKKNISYIYKERQKIHQIKHVKDMYYKNKEIKNINLFYNTLHLISHFTLNKNTSPTQIKGQNINISSQINYSGNSISKTKFEWDKLDYSIMKMIIKLTMNQNDKTDNNKITNLYNINKRKDKGNKNLKLTKNVIENNNEFVTKVNKNFIFNCLNYSYEKIVRKISNQISDNNKLYIDIIKRDFYNINRDVIVNKRLDIINFGSNTMNNSYLNNYYNTNFYQDLTIELNGIPGYSTRVWQTFYINKRKDNLMDVLRFSDKVFKPYYRYLIRLFILKDYKKFINKLGYKNLIIHCYIPLVLNKFKWFQDNNIKIFNFVAVRTLFNLFAFNYRSLYILKPKYYYINKFRFYNKKANRLKLNTWLRSIKYLKALRKAPTNYWLRYHQLIKFYYKRVLSYAKWDTERKVLMPYVMYFEDLLYNIYGKLALIRIWPLKKFFLSSYILSERLMLILDKKSNLSKRRRSITSVFTRFVYKFINIINVTKIEKIYDFNLSNSSRWPNDLINAVNEDLPIASNYNKLEYYSRKLESTYSLNSYLVKDGDLENYLPVLRFNYYNIANKFYSKLNYWIKDKSELDIIYKKGFIHYWTRPLKNYVLDITSNQDISGVEFRLAGRARSKSRAFNLIYQHGGFLGARHFNKITHKYLTITSPYLRNTLKSNMDYTQRVGNFLSGTTNLKLWYSSLLSSDNIELLAYLLKMKKILNALNNRNFIVNSNIKYFINYYKWNKIYDLSELENSRYFKYELSKNLKVRSKRFNTNINKLKNKLFNNYWSAKGKKKFSVNNTK